MPAMTKNGRRGWYAAALLWVAAVGAAPADDARVADAAMRADRAAVRTLVAQGASVNAAQPDGTTALHWAARTDDLSTAQLLLKSGAKVDAATRYGVTPLYLASVNGSAPMIDALLAAGASANAANPGGETALMTAARTGRIDAVTLLLDRGAAGQCQGERPRSDGMMWAVLENHQDVIKLLLARGADINAQTKVDVPDGTTGEPQATSGDIGAHGPGIYRSRAVPSPTGAMTPLLYAAREGNLRWRACCSTRVPRSNGRRPTARARSWSRLRTTTSSWRCSSWRRAPTSTPRTVSTSEALSLPQWSGAIPTSPATARRPLTTREIRWISSRCCSARREPELAHQHHAIPRLLSSERQLGEFRRADAVSSARRCRATSR
jgi:hypothetical protein